MAIITFTSDFGLQDGYVAIVKAKILSLEPNATIVDISHMIQPANLPDAAFLLASTYNQFPKGTVHIAAVDSVGSKGDAFIAVELNGHYFIGTNNGLLSLVADMAPSKVVEINKEESSFPARDVFAEAAVKLAYGISISDLGPELADFKRMIGRSVRATRKEIAGTVIKVDHYGNLITSINKKDFDFLSKDKTYTIKFGRQEATSLNKQSNEAEPGDWFVLFNHLGLLEIGIRNGNASQLLGLKFDSPVWIKFDE
ncbi:MAG: SAM-dependent chlorinase/fluorinase [Cyclobacteriaceae bacterium]|nr:SAM-dependent chlorinase/fluorinase [Cyclobacteriaceae bacterium]